MAPRGTNDSDNFVEFSVAEGLHIIRNTHRHDDPRGRRVCRGGGGCVSVAPPAETYQCCPPGCGCGVGTLETDFREMYDWPSVNTGYDT